MIKKKYLLWKVVKEGEKFYSHPNTFFAKKEKWIDKIRFTEYEYNQNGWYLGHIAWDNTKVTASTIQEHLEDFSKYDFKVKTPAEVITALNSFYPAPEGDDDYFSLEEDDFTIIDNRPIDEDLE